MNRQRILPILAALLVVPAAFLVLSAQTPADKSPAPKGTTVGAKSFTGKAADGNFQTALNDALQQAEAARTGADQRFEWTMGVVKGTRGGIAGTREVTVEVKLP